ncbi:hypothetical protein B9Z41_06585 [Limnohabitans sp. JirII-31]|nr:hypothetical protein B9Z41_06585 [Limnohabitans sp. JirII-31]
MAKNVFAVHGVDEAGKLALLRPNVPRAKLLKLLAYLLPMPDQHRGLLQHPPLGTQSGRAAWLLAGAIVAIAAKNVRMCWAVLKHGEGFKKPA